jgi:oxalate decarboxylase
MTKKKPSSMPPSQPTFKFDLAAAAPSISEHGNTIREANQNDFPILAGNGVAFFMIDMKPGALRVPHWHPNAWELDYCVEGEAEFWIVGPDNARNMVKQVVRIKPGQLFFIPQGWFHAIKNVSSTDLKLLLTFNNGLPSDIGIPVGLNGIGNDVFGQAFDVSPDVFNNFNESNKFFSPAKDTQLTKAARKKS